MARRNAAELSSAAQGEDAERARLRTIGDLRDRIIACGYWIFDRLGTERTSVEQICDLAGISRPTFYRHFDNKSKLLELIQEVESLKVRTEVRRRIRHHLDFEEMLVEALVLIQRATRKNHYVSGFLFSLDVASRAMDPKSFNHELQMQWWGPFIERARAAGEIAADLDVTEIVNWLNSSMILLMLQERGHRSSQAELSRFIRRYLVRPLMPQAADR